MGGILVHHYISFLQLRKRLSGKETESPEFQSKS